ncbi:unnamed protein product [Protopolystoma xenopodis]|uniref:Uncharacterized protein n=1 Tax=Protopolystoma xenopodis TaxID=117903 RepID=A0A3S5C223_9PLAT|nr:unnamed protein product [Protopolystoma xenopodis]
MHLNQITTSKFVNYLRPFCLAHSLASNVSTCISLLVSETIPWAAAEVAGMLPVEATESKAPKRLLSGGLETVTDRISSNQYLNGQMTGTRLTTLYETKALLAKEIGKFMHIWFGPLALDL